MKLAILARLVGQQVLGVIVSVTWCQGDRYMQLVGWLCVGSRVPAEPLPEPNPLYSDQLPLLGS